MTGNRASLAACFIRTFFLAWIWLAVIRGLLIIQSGVLPSLPGTLGGDVAGAFLLAVFLHLSVGVVRALLITALGVALYVAGMHLTAHGTLFQLAFAGKGMDSTFITGSLLNIYLITLPGYLVLAWLLHWLHRKWVPTSERAPVLLISSAVLVTGLYTLSFPSLTTPANNVVASTVAQVPGTLLNPVGTAIGDETTELSEQLDRRTNFFHQQTSNFQNPEPPNVLLIMIEGLSGGYLPKISQYHNLQPIVSLDTLEATFDAFGFRVYNNVLSMERQTDRGTFALVCGRYPDLRRPSEKMLAVAEDKANPDCLPGKLKDQGYTTAYWQAAPIEYMKKDQFMPRAGYENVTGAEAFGHAQEQDGWGPPDPTFFPDIAERLSELDSQRGPWFVTTLNVGTHHPFNIGPEAEQELEAEQANQSPSEETTGLPATQMARKKAMVVMANSLERFLTQLEQEGLLDNTLVIVTSDESGGFVRDDHETLPLNSNLGVLAIRSPGRPDLSEFAPENRIVAQFDIPMTILDATGNGHLAGDMLGRSLLSEPTEPARDLMLADTYTGMKYFLRESGTLLACTELTTRCSNWAFDPDRLFGSLQQTEDEPFLSFDERLALLEKATLLTQEGE
ncbi:MULTISPECIES: LTA synthase family protein [Marinobacter]|uniref:LTA synthase family protein n=1 Tax=Marinobacter TaxID=2742 RepID=UPI0012692014|nr:MULTISPECIES: LTA synthase family protein [Marinobacter]QFS86726.1 phosphoglycerol transferase I [Marinobacter sp. THAF197a]QFT50510.1 phosphoglycerol transferase I [Marinobacter sp. THAF39]BEH14204.1 hypothetical protein MAALD49_15720 [Marinobacter shengliensis]